MIELPPKLPQNLPKQDKRYVLQSGNSTGKHTCWTNEQRSFSSLFFLIPCGNFGGSFLCYKFRGVVGTFLPLKIPLYNTKKYTNLEVVIVYKWKIFSEPFQNVEHIFPLQQQRVKQMIDYLSQDHNVQCITVFGSSITPACHNESDLDIYVEIKEDKPLIHTYFDFLYDLWTNYTVDYHMLEEIKREGVIVYQKKDN